MTRSARYTPERNRAFADTVRRDGYCVLPRHFRPEMLVAWRDEFRPLLDAHVEREGHKKNRGAERYYVTLPFAPPFAHPGVYEDEDILAIVFDLVGEDAVLHQLATDTPLLGSQYQDIHRDAPPLFPELVQETPAFQLAVNFPLVDIDVQNGPVEIAKGTHLLPKDDAMKLIDSGKVSLEPVTMSLGDVMIRDVRGLHRGTPNRTNVPRPMVVLGYSRRWLNRPEVSIRIPREAVATLSSRARKLLRTNPIVESLAVAMAEEEVYQAYAY